MIYGVHFAADNNTAYALISDKLEPAQAYQVDIQTGTRTKLAAHPDVGVSGVSDGGREGLALAVSLDAQSPSIQYIAPESEWTKLHAGLMKYFPSEMLSFNSFSRDGNKVLFSVWSDRDPGSYYIFDRATGKAQKVVDYRPWLKPETCLLYTSRCV